MPYLPYFNLEDEKKKTGQEGQINISGSSNSINQPAQNIAAPKAAQRSGSWVNLNQYLDANKDNALEMSNTVGSKVEEKANNAINSSEAYKSSIPSVVDRVNENNLKADFYNNPNANKEHYQKMKSTGGYEGPQDFSKINGFEKFQQEYNQATEALKQTDTEEGRQNLVAQTYARPNYTKGQNALDQVLLQNNPNAKQKFQDIRSKFSNITSLLDSNINAASENINKNIENSLANKKIIMDSEKKTIDELLNPIKSRADEYNNSYKTKQNTINQDLSDDILNQETLALLGLDEGTNLFGLNLNDYVNYDQTPANANNMATNEERTKFANLMNLIDGMDQSITADGKKMSPVNFNMEQFMKDQGASKSEFEAFAKNKNYSSKKKGTVNDGVFDYDAAGSASANLWDYLNNGKKVNTEGLYEDKRLEETGLPKDNYALWSPYIDKAKQDVLNQILADLDAYNYNRTIKKG